MTTDTPAPPNAGKTQAATNTGKRFVKGVSGNPSGMRKGTKHRRTLMLSAMSTEDRAFVTEKIIRQARRGCRVSQRLIVDRVEPPRRARVAISALPDVTTAAGITEAMAAVIAAVGRGEISPDEAQSLAGILDTQRRALELLELKALSERIAALERKDRQ